MDSKLTLKLDDAIISQAKKYAKSKNTSLSRLIESYLGKLIEPKETTQVTAFVKSLSGVIDLPQDFDAKREYKKHLSKKYGK